MSNVNLSLISKNLQNFLGYIKTQHILLYFFQINPSSFIPLNSNLYYFITKFTICIQKNSLYFIIDTIPFHLFN